METDYKNWFQRLHHLHYIYVILILIILLVEFIAYYHCDDVELVAQVSFAASLSSIILSVLAIIITVVSNGSMDKLSHGLYNLRDLPLEIKTSVENEISKIAASTSQLSEASEENAKNNELLQERLEGLIHELDCHMADRFKQNEETMRSIVSENSQTQQRSVGLEEHLSEKNEKLNGDIIDDFLSSISNAGYSLIYAVDKYIRKSITTPFDLEEMNNIYNNNTFSQYLYGCLITCSSFKLFDYSSTDGLKFVFTSINPTLSELFRNSLGKTDIDHAILAKIDDYLEKLENSNSEEGEPREK